ncbi:MAG: hypothetical protein R2762_17615 [Bryobacteraceae bacterium]
MESFSGPGGHEFLVDMARANCFVAVDLEANRAGKTTRPQLIRVWLHALKPLRVAGAALVGWMVMLMILHTFLPGIAQGFVLKKLGLGALGPMVGMFGAFVLAVLKCSRRTVLLVADAVNGDVAHVVGRVAPSFEENHSHGLGRWRGETDAVYHYCIRDQEFEVTREAHILLVGKYDTYRPLVRIYFMPRSQLLLSVEPVEGSAIAAAEAEPRQHWMFQPSSEPLTIEPTYFAVRRNFDLIPRQWASDPSLAAPAAAKPVPRRRRGRTRAAGAGQGAAVQGMPPEAAGEPANGPRRAAGMPLPPNSGTPIRRSLPPAAPPSK